MNKYPRSSLLLTVL